MRVHNASYDGERLALEISKADASAFLEHFKADGNYTIKLEREKRSNDANRFAWSLITQLSDRVGRNPIDIYRDAIRNIGGVTDTVRIRTIAKADFVKAFTDGHIGRFCDTVDDEGGWTTLLVTYGSSDYDTRQMSQLIDGLIQDCKSIGIRVDGFDIDSMIDAWGKRYGNK